MNDFTITDHAWLTLAALSLAAVFWLGDGFMAERFMAGRDVDLGALSPPDNVPQPPEDSRHVRETAEKSSRYVALAALAAGGVLGLWLVWRLVF